VNDDEEVELPEDGDVESTVGEEEERAFAVDNEDAARCE